MGTPKKERLAVVVTWLSELDGIAIPEALPEFWAWPRAQAELGCSSPGEVGLHQSPNMEAETFLHTERQIPATRLLDPTEDLMDSIHMGPDDLMLDCTVVAADAFVGVGCCEPPSDFALALAMLLRSRLAVMVTELSKLGRIARVKAPSEILAGPPALRVGGWLVWTPKRSRLAVAVTGLSKLDGIASDFALALAVLSRSRLAVVVTGLSKLDGVARMEAPANFRHSLWHHQSGGGRWELQEREDSLLWSLGWQNWMGLRFLRPCPNFGHGLRRRQSSDAPHQGRLDHTKNQTWNHRHNSTLSGKWLPLAWHSRCFRDQDSLSWSRGYQNLMGLREWRSLPNFWHSLRRRKSGGGKWGLQKGEDLLWWSLGCQNWVGLRFQRPCPNFGHSLQRRQSSDAPHQGRLDHTKGRSWNQGHNSTLNGKFLPLAHLIRPMT